MTHAAQTSLILSQGIKTMSSREIAELVESRHDNVKRTIETLVDKGVIPFPQSEEKPTAGRPAVEYHLDKRSSLIVVAQLSPEFTARIVDRWQELEAQVAKPPAPTELTRMDILKLAMESEEARVKAEAERDHAIATKHLIGSRREASAMAAASHAKRQVESLKQKLGEAQRWASVKAVERATGRTLAWKPLRDWCNANEVEIKKVFDANYGTVNSYPLQAWRDVYQIDLSGLFAETV